MKSTAVCLLRSSIRPKVPPILSPGTALLEGKQQKSGVAEVFDYLIHECLQYDKANFCPETIMENQTNSIPHYPADIHYADMTGIEDPAEKERLLAMWKY